MLTLLFKTNKNKRDICSNPCAHKNNVYRNKKPITIYEVELLKNILMWYLDSSLTNTLCPKFSRNSENNMENVGKVGKWILMETPKPIESQRCSRAMYARTRL